MNTHVVRMDRHAAFRLGLVILAALSFGLASAANAAGPQKAITAAFDPTMGVLTITGNAANNNIAISRTTAGAILVNGGAVKVQGGKPTVATTREIQVVGKAGNDQLALDQAMGSLPRASMAGGDGNDTLIGGAGKDVLLGEAGTDTLQGMAGDDLLDGGTEDDLLIGGDGNDQVYGHAGTDRLVWNAGDDSDLDEGGDGIDTVEAAGGNGAETFAGTANGTRVRFDQLSPAASFLDIGTTERLVLNANGGDDTFSATGNLAALIQFAVDGGAGTDMLLGSNGADTLSGGDGNDTVDGQQGNDTALLGSGDDIFQWDPGDGNDIVEGQAGADTLRFNGSGAAEAFDAAANGERLRFVRNVANIVMDLNEVETVEVNAAGAADSLTVNDLSSTDVVTLNVNLASTPGGTGGDGQPDQIVVKGSSANDAVDILANGTGLTVGGLPWLVAVANTEGANDTLVVESLAGDDVLNAGAPVAGIVKLRAEGGGGADTLRFTGSGDNEQFDIGANGERVVFFRNPATLTVDLNDVETIDLDADGGTDTIAVGMVSGTDLSAVRLNLAAPGDAPDRVFVGGTPSADVITVSGSAASGVALTGLPAGITITAQAGAATALIVNGLDGADQIDAGALAANTVTFAANGGLGTDTVVGSQGDDVVSGGDGDDLAMLGVGADTFVWNPGDDNDVVEGQDGGDTLLFNGSNAAEQIAVAANGHRVRFSRDVATVATDLNDVETISFNALGGVDRIVVGDLSGTDLTAVNLNLTVVGASGDGQLDSVIVHGTDGDDAMVATGDFNGTTVEGLAATVRILGAEMDNDGLVVGALAGADTLDASGLANGAIQLTAYGGDGNDELTGGDNADVLSGDDGDDVLRGGPGVDVLDGGPGNNIVTQD